MKTRIKMKGAPKIKLELTTADKVFEAAGWIAVLIIWIMTITNYAKLPGTIPTHYNGLGQPDGFGGKATILGLPAIATIVFAGLTILNKYPHIFNYPARITEGNASRRYTDAVRMIRYLKPVIVLIFGLIAFKTIQNAVGQANGLGAWFLPVTLCLVFIPLTYFVVRSLRTKH